MQISLRSQMIAGATAVVGATAVAMTPIAPAVQLPTLSATKAAVELAAWANPIQALVGSVNLGVNYLINDTYTYGADGGVANWGLESGIEDNVNQDILPFSCWDDGTGACQPVSVGGALPAITAVGLIPNFLSDPFPVATQLASNWIGYANTAWQAGGAAIGNLTTVLWAPVGLTAAVVTALLTGQGATIPAIIQGAAAEVVANLQSAVQAVVGGVTTIVQNVVARAQAVVTFLATALPAVVTGTTNQIATLVSTTQAVVGSIGTALVGGDFNGAWNAAVAGLLGPVGVPGVNVTIPGDLINLTLGAGVQNAAVNSQADYYANVVPSVRNELQSLGQGLSLALQTTPAPVAAASVRSAAAAKTGKPAAAVAATEASAAGDSTAAPAKRGPAKAVRHAAAARAAAAK